MFSDMRQEDKKILNWIVDIITWVPSSLHLISNSMTTASV